MTKTGNLGLMVNLSRNGNWIMNTDTGIAENTAPPSSVQTETCARYHSRRIALSEEYEHGKPLTNTYRPQVLLQDLYFADGQIQDEVYVYGSFIQSKMHAKGVVCTDCHDPHTLDLRAEGNALCAGCHLAARFDTPEHHFHQPDGVAAPVCYLPYARPAVHGSRCAPVITVSRFRGPICPSVHVHLMYVPTVIRGEVLNGRRTLLGQSFHRLHNLPATTVWP